MASSYYKLDIENRSEMRTRGSKSLRLKGIIPGVLYYSGEENINISINELVLFHALRSGQRIFEINQSGEKQYTMIKEVQYHPVTDEIIHIDLMRVRRSEKMTISVPLILIGEAVGVKAGGILSQSLNQIEISCFPTDVPEQIELNIEDLELNSAKSVGDIKLENKDIEIISDFSLNVVSVTPPAAEEEPEPTEMEEDGIEEDDDSKEDSAEEKTDDTESKDDDSTKES